MKLSELRPCDKCGGRIIDGERRFFFVVRVSQAMVNEKAMRSTGGLLQMFGGIENPGALGVAEVFSPDDEVVRVLSDEASEAQTELFLCMECLGKDLNLMALTEHRQIEEASGMKATEIEGNDVEAFAEQVEEDGVSCGPERPYDPENPDCLGHYKPWDPYKCPECKVFEKCKAKVAADRSPDQNADEQG